MNKAIIHAFEVVTSCDHFRHRWIPDYVLVGVINFEYDIPAEKMSTTANLHRAVGRDLRCINSPIESNMWGAYFNLYSPKVFPDGMDNDRGVRVKCYFLTDAGILPSKIMRGETWYTSISNESVDEKHYLNLEEHEKQELLSKLRKKKVEATNSEPVAAHCEKRVLEFDLIESPPSNKKRKEEPLEVLSPTSAGLKLMRKRKSANVRENRHAGDKTLTWQRNKTEGREHASREHATKLEERTLRRFIESMMLHLNVECAKDLDLAELVVMGMLNRIRQEKEVHEGKKRRNSKQRW
jgi:hypothetical protein